MGRIINKFGIYFRLFLTKKRWRKENKHNSTFANSIFDFSKVKVGYGSYGPIELISYGSNNEVLEIGSFCSLASNVKFFLGEQHRYDSLSTFPFRNVVLHEDIDEGYSKGDISIGDDVWIGYGSLIMSGVSIGQGAIIGAGSIVSKDIPPYSIYVGNKVVKKRFDDFTIEKLNKFSYSRLKYKEIQDNIDTIYSKVDNQFFGSDFYLNNSKGTNADEI